MAEDAILATRDRALHERESYKLEPEDEGLLATADGATSRVEEIRALLEETGAVVIMPVVLDELAQFIGAGVYILRGQISRSMTTDRAREIRRLRVEERLSWRGVARATADAWGQEAIWEPRSNQPAGMILCEAAARLLGEDYLEDPWN